MLQYGLAFGNKWKENGWLAGYIGRYCKLSLSDSDTPVLTRGKRAGRGREKRRRRRRRTNLGMTYSCVCMNADNPH